MFQLNHDYNSIAKKSKATIEIIVKVQPDTYEQNEVWYNAGSDKDSIDNHVDSDFRETGKFYYMHYYIDTELYIFLKRDKIFQ